MPVTPHMLVLAALFAADPELGLRLHAPANPAAPDSPADEGPAALSGPERLPFGEDAVPMPPGSFEPPAAHRKLGTSTTIFVNFDGVKIEHCSPSNSHANCHWLESGRTFEPFSGALPQRVAILDAMREQVADFGIRVTGQRPPADEPYMMLVYGGESDSESDEAEALGRAPAGDCWDDLPNQIGYVYLDGERADWVSGGASTALHEAGHTWGLDHIGLEGSLMAPMGGNTVVNFFDGCAQIVENTELEPSEAGSCPGINLEQCGLPDFQHDVALLRLLFGAPYLDDTAPQLELVRPFDGVYYPLPGTFDVQLAVIDDLHPQVYELAIGIVGLVEDPEFRPVYDPSFEVVDLPVGEWEFQLRLRDAAGNEGALAFTVVIGEQPLQRDDGCGGCSSASASSAGGERLAPVALGLLLGLARLRRRRSRCPTESARQESRAPCPSL